MALASKLAVAPDCLTYPCQQECCSVGCDVWPHERSALLHHQLAGEADFHGPYQDEEGDWLYRTAVAGRGRTGCVFLAEARGCRLHATGLKPSVCVVVPRSPKEADELAHEGMLPCRDRWRV